MTISTDPLVAPAELFLAHKYVPSVMLLFGDDKKRPQDFTAEQVEVQYKFLHDKWTSSADDRAGKVLSILASVREKILRQIAGRALLDSSGPRALSEVLTDGAYGKILRAIEMVTTFECKAPRIVTIGNQSEGKSSTLERIALRAIFPRAEGVCTRMPIILKLRNARTSRPIVVRLLDSDENVQSSWEFPHDSQDELIGSKVLELQQQTLAGQEVTEDLIEVEIASAGVPDLTLVDLPGVVSSSVDENKKSITENLTKKFIQDKNTLVVLVLSASGNFDNKSVLSILTECDNTSDVWKRTMCVMTKSDTLGPRELKRVTDRITGSGVNGEERQLIGCEVVPVVNRDTEADQQLTFEQARVEERAWFEESLPGLETPHGIDAVLIQLDKMIGSFIAHKWIPRQILAVNEEKLRKLRELNRLGLEPNAETLKILAEEMQPAVERIAYGTEFPRDHLQEWIRAGMTATEAEISQVTPAVQTRIAFFNTWKKIWSECAPDWVNDIIEQSKKHLLSFWDERKYPFHFHRFPQLRKWCEERLHHSMHEGLESLSEQVQRILARMRTMEYEVDWNAHPFFALDEKTGMFCDRVTKAFKDTCVYPAVAAFASADMLPPSLDWNTVLAESCADERCALQSAIERCDAAVKTIETELAEFNVQNIIPEEVMTELMILFQAIQKEVHRHIRRTLQEPVSWEKVGGAEIKEAVFLRQDGPVTDVAFSPDGTQISGNRGVAGVWLWDAQSGAIVRKSSRILRTKYTAEITSEGSGNITFKVVDSETGALVQTVSHSSGSVNDRCDWHVISPDGTRIAFLMLRSPTVMHIRSSIDEDVMQDISLKRVPSRLEFSSCGRLLIRTVHNTIYVRNIATKRDLDLQGLASNSNAFAVSECGGFLVFGGTDNTVRVWDTKSGKQVNQFDPKGAVGSITISPTGKQLACVMNGNTVRIWDIVFPGQAL